MIWSFDDLCIGKMQEGAPALSTREIARPLGLSNFEWYSHAKEICKHLNMQPWPEALTLELSDILGMPNFSFIDLARLARDSGISLKPRSEDEQAFWMHRMLGHWFKHGVKWRDAMAADVEALVKKVRDSKNAGQ